MIKQPLVFASAVVLLVAATFNFSAQPALADTDRPCTLISDTAAFVQVKCPAGASVAVDGRNHILSSYRYGEPVSHLDVKIGENAGVIVNDVILVDGCIDLGRFWVAEVGRDGVDFYNELHRREIGGDNAVVCGLPERQSSRGA